MSLAATLQEAIRDRPEAVSKALYSELDVFDRKECWKPVNEDNLSDIQRRLIISQGNTWKEKVDAEGNYIKDKMRNVIHGNRQMEWAIAETYGAVCRTESVFTILSLAAMKGMILFKIDFVSAYLNTPMPVLLNKMVSADLFVEILINGADT